MKMTNVRGGIFMSDISTCLWCGRKTGSIGGMKPCHICSEQMKKGIILIITEKDDPAFKEYFRVNDPIAHMGKYLSEWYVINKREFKKKLIRKLSVKYTKNDIKSFIENGVLWLNESEIESENIEFSTIFNPKRIIHHYKKIY